jgi:hypothetical protein
MQPKKPLSKPTVSPKPKPQAAIDEKLLRTVAHKALLKVRQARKYRTLTDSDIEVVAEVAIRTYLSLRRKS